MSRTIRLYDNQNLARTAWFSATCRAGIHARKLSPVLELRGIFVNNSTDAGSTIAARTRHHESSEAAAA
jgi:hypothetical protein